MSEFGMHIRTSRQAVDTAKRLLDSTPKEHFLHSIESILWERLDEIDTYFASKLTKIYKERV